MVKNRIVCVLLAALTLFLTASCYQMMGVRRPGVSRGNTGLTAGGGVQVNRANETSLPFGMVDYTFVTEFDKEQTSSGNGKGEAGKHDGNKPSENISRRSRLF